MNKRQKEFLIDYIMIMFFGSLMMLIAGVFIYFGIKLYGKDAILLAAMGGVFCMGLISIAKLVGYSYSLGFRKGN